MLLKLMCMTCVTRYIELHKPMLPCEVVSLILVSSIQLYDKYSDFVTPEDKEGLIAKLQEVEDWLYEDGEDETKGVYIAKLEELKKVCLLQHACTLSMFDHWYNVFRYLRFQQWQIQDFKPINTAIAKFRAKRILAKTVGPGGPHSVCLDLPLGFRQMMDFFFPF